MSLGRVGTEKEGHSWQSVIHLQIHSFAHSLIHATNVYTTPVKCPQPYFAEENAAFR